MFEDKIEIWLGTDESAYTSYARSMEKLMRASAAELSALSSHQKEREYESRLLSVEGDIGIVKVSGSMTYEESPYLEYFGMVSYSEIYDAVVEAAVSPDVREIVMMYDTSGGTTKGINTALEGIAEAKTLKPVHTYTSGDMRSAGYWLGSAGSTITMSEGASVGSIGVIGVVKIAAEMYKKAGVEVHVFRSSPDKAPITPFEPLSEEGAAVVKEEIAFEYGNFIDALADNMDLAPEYIKQTFGGGKVYRADEALSLGMVGRVQSYNDYFREKLSEPSSSQQGSGYGTLNFGGAPTASSETVPGTRSQSDITGNEMSKPSKIITAQDQAAALEGLDFDEAQLQALADAANENGETEASGSEELPEGEETGVQPLEAAEALGADGALSLITEKFAAAVEETAALKAQVSSLTAAAELNEAVLTKMSAVTAESINRMNVILGRGAQDLSNVTASNLLQMHSEVHASVIKHIPVGQRSQASTEDTAVDEAVEAVGEQFAHLTTR